MLTDGAHSAKARSLTKSSLSLTMMRLPTRVEMLVTRVNELPNSSSGTCRDTFWRLKSGVSSVVEGIGALVGLMASFRAWLDCLLAWWVG